LLVCDASDQLHAGLLSDADKHQSLSPLHCEPDVADVSGNSTYWQGKQAGDAGPSSCTCNVKACSYCFAVVTDDSMMSDEAAEGLAVPLSEDAADYGADEEDEGTEAMEDEEAEEAAARRLKEELQAKRMVRCSSPQTTAALAGS
jgi:hypothetical protein